MFVFNKNDERYKQYMVELNQKVQKIEYPREDQEDPRPLLHQVLDCEFKYQDVGVAQYEVSTTRGVTVVPKEDLISLCASQEFCVAPTREVAPLLPSRGAPATGQLKICADVVAMFVKLRKTDKVLVIGSSSEHEVTGSAYFMLAGRVAEVDMYDPYEVNYVESVIKGTRFRFHKEFWTKKKIEGYDVVFDDAWLSGDTIVHDIRARECSQKVFSIKDHQRSVKRKGYYHGQIHVAEKRFTNTPRYYQGYKHVGTCVACREIGFFFPDLDVYDRIMLSASHGPVKCTSRITGCARRIGVYADLLFNRMMIEPPTYEKTQKPVTSITTAYDTQRDSVISYGGCNVLRRLNTVSVAGPERFESFGQGLMGPLVIQVDISPYLVFVTRNILVVMDRCYMILDHEGDQRSVYSEWEGSYVSSHVDALLVNIPERDYTLLFKGVKVAFTWRQVRRLVMKGCKHVFSAIKAHQW